MPDNIVSALNYFPLFDVIWCIHGLLENIVNLTLKHFIKVLYSGRSNKLRQHGPVHLTIRRAAGIAAGGSVGEQGTAAGAVVPPFARPAVRLFIHARVLHAG